MTSLRTPPSKPGKARQEPKVDGRDNPEQSRLFLEKAREIEADGKRSSADKLMGRLVKMKPEPRKGKSGG